MRGLIAEEGKKQLDKKIIGGVISDSSMVLIPGGKFQMGSSNGEADEKPVHEVTISSFYLSKYEVTVAEFSKFIDETSYQTDADKDGGSYVLDGQKWEKKSGINWKYNAEGKLRPSSKYNHPVIHVSWNDAVEYCKWLSKKTGQVYRLPTEAEWEYAAGNGNKHTKYSWGNATPSGKQGGNVADETAKSKFNDWTIFEGYNDGSVYTAPVGSFAANEYGLFDMSGNVYEWCQDWYNSDYYANSPSSNPPGPNTGPSRVYRGGTWNSYPLYARVVFRSYDTPDSHYDILGFRLARQQ
jgi:formylglycine-generating enzyme required for sulfatase activity